MDDAPNSDPAEELSLTPLGEPNEVAVGEQTLAQGAPETQDAASKPEPVEPELEPEPSPLPVRKYVCLRSSPLMVQTQAGEAQGPDRRR